MKRLRLTAGMIITGRDFFGRRAWIHFAPTDLSGWFWMYDPKERHPAIPITSNLLHRSLRRTVLAYGRARINCYEHIGVLRWLGLDGVVVSSSAWPPHFGRALDFWEALRPICRMDPETKASWVTVSHRLRAEYGGGYLEIYPQDEPCLDIKVISDYPGIGYKQVRRVVPGLALPEVLGIPTQGFPRRAYYLSRLASAFGWPHHKTAVWPQEQSNEETRKLFALHRFADILGALSTVSSTAYLAGRVVSFCAGHRADVLLLRAIREAFLPLR